MNPKIKKRWVDALRSGKYKQGRKKLREFTPEGTTYCCLGVLSCLYIDENGDDPTEAYGSVLGGYYLNRKVMDWAGLDGCNPRVDSRYLANLNDGINDGDDKNGPKSFTEIADLIEKNL